MPFIAKWPEHIRPGTASSEPAINLDIFPTLLSLAGMEQPSDRIIDGKNIEGLLSGRNPRSPHDTIYFYHYDKLEGVRSGKWKYFRKLNRYVWPIPLDAEYLPDAMGKSNWETEAPCYMTYRLTRARTTTSSTPIPMSPKRCTAYSLSGNSRLKRIHGDFSFNGR